jgi:hypothetical protein
VHKTHVAIRKGNRYAGRHKYSAVGRNDSGNSRAKVRPGIPRLGIGWQKAVFGDDQYRQILIHGKSVI